MILGDIFLDFSHLNYTKLAFCIIRGVPRVAPVMALLLSLAEFYSLLVLFSTRASASLNAFSGGSQTARRGDEVVLSSIIIFRALHPLFN